MIDFPNNPTTGQVVNAPNGMSWRWDGMAWVLVSSGGVTGPQGPTGPTGPAGPPGASSTVPGPAGPAGAKGKRGSWWWNASGAPPTTIPGELPQDYYLDNANGDVWFLGGTAAAGYGEGPYGFGPYGGTT